MCLQSHTLESSFNKMLKDFISVPEVKENNFKMSEMLLSDELYFFVRSGKNDGYCNKCLCCCLLKYICDARVQKCSACLSEAKK